MIGQEEEEEGVLHHVLDLSVELVHHDLFLRLDLLVVELSVFEGMSGRCCLPCQDILSSGCNPPRFGPSSRSQTVAEVVAVFHFFPAHVEPLPDLLEVCAGLADDAQQPPHPQSDSVVASRLDDELHHLARCSNAHSTLLPLLHLFDHLHEH